MKLDDEWRREPEPQQLKLVFGWQAWILLMIIVGGPIGNLSDAIRQASRENYQTHSREIRDLQAEINKLQFEIQELKLAIDQLVEKADGATTE